MSKPILIDFMCGAGGATKGYQESGFFVVGVDIDPQPNYCGDQFVQADAINLFRGLLEGANVAAGWGLRDIAGAHASPPCQAFTDLQKQNKRVYPELIVPMRELLQRSGLLYVIENVEGAPLVEPTLLCGTMFSGLRVHRHRLFETNWTLTAPPHISKSEHPPVFTYDKRKAHFGKLNQDTSFVQVTGGGNCTIANARDAMGIDWMSKAEINEAIPPAYAKLVGDQLMARLVAGDE
jgi:hypothetical protein